MYGLSNTGSGLNLRNPEYNQSVADHHLHLVLKFAYLKDLDDVDPFNIIGVDISKESEQGKGRVYITAVINYKNTFLVNGKPVIASLALVERVACNTIFSWPFPKTIKASIMNENNALVSGLLGYQFKLEMMVPQRAKKAEIILFSFPVAIQETQDNMNDQGIWNITTELKNTVIHQRQIPGQH